MYTKVHDETVPERHRGKGKKRCRKAQRHMIYRRPQRLRLPHPQLTTNNLEN